MLYGSATLLLQLLLLLLQVPRGSHLFSNLSSPAWEEESAISAVRVNLESSYHKLDKHVLFLELVVVPFGKRDGCAILFSFIAREPGEKGELNFGSTFRNLD